MGDTDTWLVCIGASAGGLRALTSFLKGAVGPEASPWCGVFVQHLAKGTESMLAELLERRTSLEVVEAQTGAPVRPGVLYVGPPGMRVRVVDERIVVDSGTSGRPSAVDDLLMSCVDRGTHTVAVVLSGSGSDGRRACQVLADRGLPVVVQNPEEADFDGMPRSALEVLPDAVVLDAEDIGQAIHKLARGEVESLAQSIPPRRRVLRALKRHLDYDFSDYKTGTVGRQIDRRITALSLPDEAAYAQAVEADPDEAERLGGLLQVGVTSFLRDGEVWKELHRHLASVLELAEDVGTLRVWCAGTSTGQEAYTVAMLCSTFLAEQNAAVDLQVFATDSNASAVSVAANGVYSHESVQALPNAWRDRFLEQVGSDSWRVRPELRRKVVVSQHLLHRDPPFAQVHLLLCRNVLIYLRTDTQRNVIDRLHFALSPGGLLLLGKSEVVSIEQGFEPVGETTYRLYRRREGPARRALEYQPRLPRRGYSAMPSTQQRVMQLVNVAMPPTVFVDGSGQLRHVLGDVSPYLSFPRGAMTQELQSLLRSPLASTVAAALHRARREQKPVHTVGTLGALDGAQAVRVSVRIVEDWGAVSFEPDAVVNERRSALSVPHGSDGDELRLELLHTRETLQSTIEELQSANEELQSANEELLAANEELQATNEELQATNEELHTVNAERQQRIEDLTQANRDIDGMLRGMDIGTVFLAPDLTVRRATPTIRRYLPVREADIGRPVHELSHNLQDLNLPAVARQVLDHGGTVDRVFELDDGSGLLVRVTGDHGDPRGVIVNVVDITEQVEGRRRLQDVLDAIPPRSCVLGSDGCITMVNRSWREAPMYQDGSCGVGADYVAVTRSAEEHTARQALGVLESVLSGEVESGSVIYPCDDVRYVMWARSLERGGAVVTHLEIPSNTWPDSLFERTLTPLLDVSNHGLVRRMNRAARRLLGREEEDQSLPLRALVPSSAWSGWRDVLSNTGRDLLYDDLTMLSSDGGWVQVAVHANYDIVDGALLQLAPRQTRSDGLARVAGGVAHELNNVLAAVIGLSEVWQQRREELPSALSEDLDDIVAAATRGGTVTRELLSLASTEASMGRLQHVDVDAVVSEVVGLLQKTSPRSFQVRLQTIDVAQRVLADRSLLGQALINLLINARDAMNGSGVVDIRVQRFDDEVHVVVKDEGVGMESEILAQAVDPFFTTKGLDEGTGLGLTMVHNLAQRWGGELVLQSVPRQGTTATLRLRSGTVPESTLDDDPLHELLVLLVDDDVVTRRAVRQQLGMSDHIVIDQPSAAEAYEWFEEEGSPDVAILDVIMPDGSGIELARRLREDDPMIPIVFYSGYLDVTVPEELQSRWTTVLLKPAERSDLDDVIRMVVDASRAARS